MGMGVGYVSNPIQLTVNINLILVIGPHQTASLSWAERLNTPEYRGSLKSRTAKQSPVDQWS